MFRSSDEAAGYLGAMIDGEGSVVVTRRVVTVYNTDPVLISTCGAACQILGLKYTLYRVLPPGNRKPIFHLCLRGYDNLMRFKSLVTLHSPVKAANLEEVLRLWNGFRPERPAKDDLIACHATMNSRELAKYFGTTSGTVRSWLKQYGVPPRTIGESQMIRWAKKRLASVPT